MRLRVDVVTGLMTALLFSGPNGLCAQSGVREFVEEDVYRVEGATFLEVFEDIEEQGPLDSRGHRKHGMTTYELRPSWQLIERRGRCDMGSTSIVARVRVLLPEWEGWRDADADSRTAWTRFIDELRAHEYLHRDEVLSAASELYDALSELRARSCESLSTEAHRRTQEAYDELQRRQAALDAQPGPPPEDLGR